ncbi:hypothetical protein [Photobacterium sp. OFAV2-7]|uniref:hypothetical protein n=1 Tax=Photobacterium sp. OFAV2-7 TaxID=2917748 RepID=UPI001EF74348|nr:hypothetical protein [Photobacterium sp. OFAV2-7]MCG7585647.1 hypothetical protein [Photobacterium sp. OFAV2-7]
MFEYELQQARDNFESAQENHKQIASAVKRGEATEDDLMDAIEQMRQAQQELDEARELYC